jgi:hypothetical protein
MTTELNKSPAHVFDFINDPPEYTDLREAYVKLQSIASRRASVIVDLLVVLEAVCADIELDSANHNGAPGGSTELPLMFEAAIAKARGLR